jgi:type I restriction enzyme S subunit
MRNWWRSEKQKHSIWLGNKKMKDVLTWGSGGTPKTTVKEYYENGDIAWVNISDLNDGIVTTTKNRITSLGLSDSSAKMIPIGTLMIAMYGASIGKLGITGIECCTNQAIAYAQNLKGLHVKFLFHYLLLMKEKLVSLGKGGAQPNISQSLLKELPIAFPPIKVQEHIVFKIEELFSELDKAVEALETIQQQLAVYRQAVYCSIFNGLTKMDVLTSFFEVSGGLTKNSKRSGYPLKKPYLRVANVYYDMLDLSEIKNIGVTEEEVSRYLLKRDDLLIVEGNGSKSQIGRMTIWDGSIEGCLHQNHIIKARPNGKMLSRFALLYLISRYGRKQIEQIAKSTSGLYTLSVRKIEALQLPACSLDEQKKRLAEVEARLSVCDSIEQTVSAALQQAAALRQSILKQAFEGKLIS